MGYRKSLHGKLSGKDHSHFLRDIIFKKENDFMKNVIKKVGSILFYK